VRKIGHCGERSKPVRLLLRIVLFAGALALATAIVDETWDSEAATGPATIRITDRQTSFTRADVGRAGRSPGDVEVSNALVFNRRITPRPLGHYELICTYTVGINRSCSGTIFLPRGKLMVAGTLRFRQFYELAVIGGTGLYNNARGTLTVTRTGRRPARHFLFFRLAG
jgi:hypothetical protein